MSTLRFRLKKDFLGNVIMVIMSCSGGALVRARASDIVVGGCEFESRHCNLTGHIPDQHMPGPLIPP